jgi:hypothetical protein
MDEQVVEIGPIRAAISMIRSCMSSARGGGNSLVICWVEPIRLK